MYKYLLWDIDGTVIDFLASERVAIKKLFNKFGFGECSDEKLADYSQINKGYWERLERGEMKKDEILVARFKEFFKKYHLPVEMAEQFNYEYQFALGETHEFYDDAYNILKELKGKYVLAAVTNGTKYAQSKKLKESGLDQIFDYVFISEDIGADKPAKEFFDWVIDSMNISDLGEALVIGDSLTSDILGGNNAGIDTCWYNANGLDNNRGIVPKYEISDLHQVMELIL